MLPFASGPESQRASDIAIASNPDLHAFVVFEKEWILALADPAARLYPAQANLHRPLEFNGGAFLTSPRCRE